MSRRRDHHALVRWLWTSGRIDARLGRVALLPVAALWWLVSSVRVWGYRVGLFASHPLPLPSVAIGNLSVGGSGKTPLAGWVAAHYAAQGWRAGILLRGVGGDEVLEHREHLPEAIVEPDPDRVRAGHRALAAGADVLVLDDAYQRLDTRRDCNLCVVSAETAHTARWVLPAGPWREGRGALARADGLIITRKRADLAVAEALADHLAARVRGPVAIAALQLTHLEGLRSGAVQPIAALAGRRVIAACAIADPTTFVKQLQRSGALVQAESWPDHHAFGPEDVAWLLHAINRADFVVMTAKDAVKVRPLWPEQAPEPLVARLGITFDRGEDALRDLLDRVGPGPRSQSPTQ